MILRSKSNSGESTYVSGESTYYFSGESTFGRLDSLPYIHIIDLEPVFRVPGR